MNNLGLVHRRVIYAMVVALFFTGVAWAVLHYLNEVLGVDAREALAVNATLMKIHGGAAMIALVLVGTLLPRHVRIGWKLGRNSRSGVLVLALCSVLAASGYLLYYAGAEVVRYATSWIHLGVGVALPLPLAVHVWRLMRERHLARAVARAVETGEGVDQSAFATGRTARMQRAG